MADTTTGVLKLTKKGAGVLRDPARSFRPTPRDILVSPKLIREFELAEGATLSSAVRRGKMGLELADLESVCGLAPAASPPW